MPKICQNAKFVWSLYCCMILFDHNNDSVLNTCFVFEFLSFSREGFHDFTAYLLGVDSVDKWVQDGWKHQDGHTDRPNDKTIIRH